MKIFSFDIEGYRVYIPMSSIKEIVEKPDSIIIYYGYASRIILEQKDEIIKFIKELLE